MSSARQAYVAIGFRASAKRRRGCAWPTSCACGTRPSGQRPRALASEALGSVRRRSASVTVWRARTITWPMTARAQNDLAAAATSWERALAKARKVGNTLLETTALDQSRRDQHGARPIAPRRSISTGKATRRPSGAGMSARPPTAVPTPAHSSSRTGSEPEERPAVHRRRAAGGAPARGQELRGVLRQLVAAHHRFAGALRRRPRRELAQAMAIAKERNFVDSIPSLLLDEGRVLVETGDYVVARDVFMQALASEGATSTAELLIDLGRVQALLGDTGAAADALARGARYRERHGGRRPAPPEPPPPAPWPMRRGGRKTRARRSRRRHACGPTICPTPRAWRRGPTWD